MNIRRHFRRNTPEYLSGLMLLVAVLFFFAVFYLRVRRFI